VVDARRCLAWLLQVDGPFPREHRVALGDRLYGCDDCQEVCPPNRRADRADPPPAADGAEAVVDLLDLLAATDDELLARHGRWYVPRREARYLRRNALVVLGNVADGRDARVAAALRRCLAWPDPLVRAHAVWASSSTTEPRATLTIMPPGPTASITSREIRPRFEASARQATTRMSLACARASRDSARGQAEGFGLGPHQATFMPQASTRRAIASPIWPRPTTPQVRPRKGGGKPAMRGSLRQAPSRTTASPATIRRQPPSSRPRPVSATSSAFSPWA